MSDLDISRVYFKENSIKKEVQEPYPGCSLLTTPVVRVIEGGEGYLVKWNLLKHVDQTAHNQGVV